MNSASDESGFAPEDLVMFDSIFGDASGGEVVLLSNFMSLLWSSRQVSGHYARSRRPPPKPHLGPTQSLLFKLGV